MFENNYFLKEYEKKHEKHSQNTMKKIIDFKKTRKNGKQKMK